MPVQFCSLGKRPRVEVLKVRNPGELCAQTQQELWSHSQILPSLIFSNPVSHLLTIGGMDLEEEGGEN